ncbi:MAG: UDP-3-O-(3-hydroxymyristoyl)glucosamine N-acyltransferase [Candidatus Rhabdochlamydia sp.]
MEKSLLELSQITQTEMMGNPHHLISGVADLHSATSSELSFLENSKYTSLLEKTQAGVICVQAGTPLSPHQNYLICSSPTQTFQEIIKLFYEESKPQSGFRGIHPTAVIHPTVKLGVNVTIGPYAVIDANCMVGDSSLIESHVFLGASVSLGTHCHLYPHSTVREGCRLGNRVILQPGCVIGSCGFGYFTDKQGRHQKQDQMGIVVLEDDVEVGANTTIDRARFSQTRISQGTKIDNLVQIAHNVSLGAHNLIVSQTGISGSVKTGHHVVMGGQAGTVGHIEIASGALFAARSGIKKSIKSPGKYGGDPVTSLYEHQKERVHMRNLDKLSAKIKELEQKVEELSLKS